MSIERLDRRGFLKLFSTASVGVPVAQHLGLLAELSEWVLGPQKTIFIPRLDAVPGRVELGIPYYECNWTTGEWKGISRQP